MSLRCLTIVPLLAGCSFALAGPLDPPAGPISPTHKTLTQVEPRTPISAATTPGDADSTFRITQSGSYYLTGNLIGDASKRGIEVAASNVTIDLNGFALTGRAGSLAAISDTGEAVANIVVKNGTISDWPGGGIIIFARNAVISEIAVNDVGSNGIQVGFSAIITRCTVDSVFGFGPANAGIRAQCCSVIDSCRVATAFSGSGHGISVADTCVIRNCAVNNAGGAGIYCTNPGNIVEACTVVVCDVGISVSGGSIVRGCSVSSINSGPAISVAGSDNRIERNNVRASQRGLHVTNAGNMILGNTASGNTTNFDIANGNFGLFLAPTPGAAFAGSAGGSSLGSSDSNTNYSY